MSEQLFRQINPGFSNAGYFTQNLLTFFRENNFATLRI